MLRIDDRLASYAIGAGEPWIMGVQMKMMTGSAVIDWSNRRLVLSFYEAGRVLFDQIEGVYSSDASGAYFAFIRDGRFSESLLGKSVQVELAERLQNGRNIIATGPLSVATSSAGVTSYGSIIGRVEARFTLYFTASNLIALVEQELLPYGGVPITPGPVITSPTGINSDGTPQVGETFTLVRPIGNGPVVAERLLENGVDVFGEVNNLTFVGRVAGTLRYEADIRGPDNTTATSGSTITVAGLAVTLGALSLSGTPKLGVTSNGTINGATSGSTITDTLPGLTINSTARTYSFDGTGTAGTFSNGLVETHPNATNSGRESAVTIAAATVTPTPNTVTRNGANVTRNGAAVTRGTTSSGGQSVTYADSPATYANDPVTYGA